MSRQNINQPMQNGIPPQWCGTQVPQKSPNFTAQPVNNGLGSSQSSRDSSPMSRPPPQRGNIPASQLPPGRSGVSTMLPHANGPTVSASASATPQSSPRMTPFSTSTPINNKDVTSEVQVRNQNIQHASSTPVLPQMPPVKQNLNQPNIPRPLSTGPQLEHEPSLQSQSHFSQSQNQLNQLQQVGNPVSQQQFSKQPSQIQSSAASQFVQPQHSTSSPLQSNVQQIQAQNQPQQVGNVGKPVSMQQFSQQHQNSVASSQAPFSQSQHSLGARLQTPFPQQTQNSVPQQQQQPRLPQPVVSQFNPPQQNIPPVAGQRLPQPPGNVNYPAVPPTQSAVNTSSPVSNLRAKRYPQPAQNLQNQQQQQYPQSNIYPQPPEQQQNVNVPPTNAFQQQYNNQQQPYNNQQQSNVYYQQQQQQQPQQQNQQQYAQNYQQQLNQQRNYQNLPQQMQNMNVVKGGFNKLWGNENYDLLQCPNVLPEEQIQPPKVSLGQEFLDQANCSPEIFRCTMTKIPESNSLLQKSRLPLGVLIHPFKDLNHLPVISCNTIVRCRACRTYINPFIFFVDSKRWKCNLCYRVNELPEEFQYDPVSKTYGDPSRRPEIKSSTIEYIAPSEYMLRPPQPAVYLFLLDISRLAVESGYLYTMCEVLSSQLSTLPGDARTQIGFVAYDSTLHFFSLAEGLSQPHEMIVSDIDDVFLPCPDNLLVNLKEHADLVADLLAQLPTRYQNSFDTGSALGAALQAAHKLMGATGGRVTVFQATLPTLGPGALTVREDPNQRAGKEAPHLNPATDFYKRLALDCSGHQVAVDLFLMNSQYVDVATLSGISRFSGGCMYHFPLFKASRVNQSESLERCFRRYLTRKIGFEAVMRIRVTRGLAIHTFHGNFFVRSTDLLSLPNVNPDAGFGMQVSIEESLSDLQSVCFQAALLYTSSKGERRIRVHTLCLPVVTTLSDVLNSADQQCIVGLLAKMAVDRSLQSSLSDARDAFINVAIDILSSYKLSLNMGSSNSGLLAPQCLKLLPLYILALLKCTAFRTGQSTRLDDRVFAMCDMKTLPLPQLVQTVYPDLYPVYRLQECPQEVDADGSVIPKPRRLQLTARNIDSHGAYLLDAGQEMILFVCQNVSQQFLVHSLGVPNYNSIPDQCYELQKIENPDNERLHAFINRLNDEKPYPASLQVMRENSPSRNIMLEKLIEDRIEFALSYNEFLQHLKTQVK